MKKIQLVADWRSARKWLSVKCMALAGALQGAWMYVPDEMKTSVPPGLVGKVTLGLLVLGLLGRLLQQEPIAAPAAEDVK